MEEKSEAPATVDAYIAQYPENVQMILNELRALIRRVAPEAEERIGYQMPGYYLNGGLVWFGAFKQHIGLYPTPAGLEAFEAELAGYKRSKGAVQFPLDQPMPYDLIERLVRQRVEEHQNKKKKK